MIPSDAEIVLRLRRGDPGGFDLAFARYRGPIYGFLLRMSRKREVAEDLLQETFLRLAARAPDLAEDTHLRGWLFAVARNLYASHRRWSWADGTKLLDLAAGWLRGPDPGPFEHAAASEAQARLEAALAGLPDPQREALLLVAFERLEPAEAAEVLGIRPEALRQRLARARESLGKALGRPLAMEVKNA